MLIKGYDYGPLVAGDGLLERAGFWSNHLLAMCRFTSGETRPAPEWFGDDGADTDALAEVLLDDQAWPAFRIPFQGGHSAVVVYRNLIDNVEGKMLRNLREWQRDNSAPMTLNGHRIAFWKQPGVDLLSNVYVGRRRR
ncbi:hypothetical protein ACFV4P_22665 [Kitasatospora sp. NPDC059795]|uniref:hypothetical protein n=1 Tax=Kitasatospora sp. NPDC059795 TaxID=3346949 RepID=UPI003646ADC0